MEPRLILWISPYSARSAAACFAYFWKFCSESFHPFVACLSFLHTVGPLAWPSRADEICLAAQHALPQGLFDVKLVLKL